MLVATAGTEHMRESFCPDDPRVFTREWFAWANSLLAEFVLHSVRRTSEVREARWLEESGGAGRGRLDLAAPPFPLIRDRVQRPGHALLSLMVVWRAARYVPSGGVLRVRVEGEVHPHLALAVPGRHHSHVSRGASSPSLFSILLELAVRVVVVTLRHTVRRPVRALGSAGLVVGKYRGRSRPSYTKPETCSGDA